MKLCGVLNGRIYCTDGYETGVWTPANGFEGRGRLPAPTSGTMGLVSHAVLRRLLRPVVGVWQTANCWPLGDGLMLGASGTGLYRSANGGRRWQLVHHLPDSSPPMGTLSAAVCRHDGTLYLAEYSLGNEPARICASTDDGRTWETYLETTAVRHFHGVFRDPYTETLWATTGDRDRECAIGRLRSGSFHRVGQGSQRWRAVELAFTPTAVVWGVDCAYTDPVEILRLDRGEERPTTVGVTDGPVYGAESIDVGDETVVALATAAVTGPDSTAPPGKRENVAADVARVLVASSATDYEEWHELGAFRRRRTLGSSLPGVPSANAHVFLASEADTGLVFAPFNTHRAQGTAVRVPPARLRRLASADVETGA